MCVKSRKLTVYIQLIQFHINPFPRTFAFEKLTADEFNKSSAFYVELGGKVCSVNFPCFAVGFVEDIFFIDTKSCRVASLRQEF